MSRRFTFVTLALTAVVAFLVGAIVAGGGGSRATVAAGPGKNATMRAARATAPAVGLPINFADVVQRINPAVVNIDSTMRGRDGRRKRSRPGLPDPPDLF